MKVVTKKLLRALAFSAAVLAIDASFFCKEGILFLIFVCEFTYDQDFLGAVFASAAMLFFKLKSEVPSLGSKAVFSLYVPCVIIA